MNITSLSVHLDRREFARQILNLMDDFHTKGHYLDVSLRICKKLQLPFKSLSLLCIQSQGYIQLVVRSSLCEKLILSHILQQAVWPEMKRHSYPQLILLSAQTIQTELVSPGFQTIQT